MTVCLLRQVRLRGGVWESCCGGGSIAAMPQAHQNAVSASDLEDRGFGEAGVDFLGCAAFPPDCGAMAKH